MEKRLQQLSMLNTYTYVAYVGMGGNMESSFWINMKSSFLDIYEIASGWRHKLLAI